MYAAKLVPWPWVGAAITAAKSDRHLLVVRQKFCCPPLLPASPLPVLQPCAAHACTVSWSSGAARWLDRCSTPAAGRFLRHCRNPVACWEGGMCRDIWHRGREGCQRAHAGRGLCVCRRAVSAVLLLYSNRAKGLPPTAVYPPLLCRPALPRLRAEACRAWQHGFLVCRVMDVAVWAGWVQLRSAADRAGQRNAVKETAPPHLPWHPPPAASHAIRVRLCFRPPAWPSQHC